LSQGSKWTTIHQPEHKGKKLDRETMGNGFLTCTNIYKGLVEGKSAGKSYSYKQVCTDLQPSLPHTRSVIPHLHL